MGTNTKIEWAHHTFNPWWGCVKVSEACKHCYADSWAKRTGRDLWGPNSERRFFGANHWSQPKKWDRQASLDGVRYRVFCASMGDVFEDRRDLDAPREELWKLITETPNIDWLLLTKRPDKIGNLVPWQRDWPSNIWLGTTVENQEAAELRIPHLVRHQSLVKFLSCEPLLGELKLEKWITNRASNCGISWVIAGGESGPKARPSCPSWFESLRDTCVESDAAFHFKQWGNWAPHKGSKNNPRIHDFSDENEQRLFHVGKKLGGRLLGGRTWDEVPEPNHESNLLDAAE